MSSETQQGFVLYFDALSALSRQVDCGQISAEDAFSVVTALGQYAQTGEEPEAGSLSPVASMAYAMMIVGVKKSLAKYAEKAKKSRRAAHARWESDASHSMQERSGKQSAHRGLSGPHALKRLGPLRLALERMRASTAPTITPAEAAKVMGCHPHTIRVMARENPENLGFPVSVIGSRTIIPRLPFIRYIEEGHSDRGKEGIA